MSQTSTHYAVRYSNGRRKKFVFAGFRKKKKPQILLHYHQSEMFKAFQELLSDEVFHEVTITSYNFFPSFSCFQLLVVIHLRHNSGETVITGENSINE